MTPLYNSRPWGNLPDGTLVDLITLTSTAGATAEISNYGGIIRSLTIPLANGFRRNVVLGYETPAEYAADTYYIGMTIGPYANRIRDGKFTLDGVQYLLEQNEGVNTLHGGVSGWHRAVFDYTQDGDALLLHRRSPDGEGGFPGNVDVCVRFFWQNPMTLAISYEADTDRPTVISMTQHSYFNLGAEDTILSHSLQLRAGRYILVDSDGLPTGEIAPTAGTTFDFQTMRPIENAYDHNFVLTTGVGPAATLTAPDGALVLDVFTDKPGLQLYTGAYLDTSFPTYGGLCLETQHFPDAPNIPLFPSAVVRPEQWYRSTTKFSFSAP